MSRFLAALALWFCATGCGKVAAYERGRLLSRPMKEKPALDAAFASHVSELRESAVGASTGESASCGCR